MGAQADEKTLQGAFPLFALYLVLGPCECEDLRRDKGLETPRSVEKCNSPFIFWASWQSKVKGETEHSGWWEREAGHLYFKCSNTVFPVPIDSLNSYPTVTQNQNLCNGKCLILFFKMCAAAFCRSVKYKIELRKLNLLSVSLNFQDSIWIIWRPMSQERLTASILT